MRLPLVYVEPSDGHVVSVSPVPRRSIITPIPSLRTSITYQTRRPRGFEYFSITTATFSKCFFYKGPRFFFHKEGRLRGFPVPMLRLEPRSLAWGLAQGPLPLTKDRQLLEFSQASKFFFLIKSFPKSYLLNC